MMMMLMMMILIAEDDDSDAEDDDDVADTDDDVADADADGHPELTPAQPGRGTHEQIRLQRHSRISGGITMFTMIK